MAVFMLQLLLRREQNCSYSAFGYLFTALVFCLYHAFYPLNYFKQYLVSNLHNFYQDIPYNYRQVSCLTNTDISQFRHHCWQLRNFTTGTKLSGNYNENTDYSPAKEGHEDDQRPKAPPIWAQAERVGALQPGQEKSPEGTFQQLAST